MVGGIASTPLRRDRPLWEMWLIDGLPEKRWAIVMKMHHSTIDGVAGASLMSKLLDLSPSPNLVIEPRPRPRPTSVPSPVLLLGRTLWIALAEPVQIARLLPPTLARLASSAWQIIMPAGPDPHPTSPFHAPRTRFNAAVSRRRAVAFTEVPLADVKALKDALGVTVNDVVTAIVGGGLRRYLEERGELPQLPLIAAEPVSVHGKATGVEATTKVSMMVSNLATDIEDPIERLEAVAAGNRAAKQFQGTLGEDTFLKWMEHIWQEGIALGARLYSGLRLADHLPVVCNLILSDVPGPPVPLYVAGARLIGVYPLGPILDGMGLNITVLSEEDRLGFGVVTCPDLVPDVWSLADTFSEALAELQSASDRATVQR